MALTVQSIDTIELATDGKIVKNIKIDGTDGPGRAGLYHHGTGPGRASILMYPNGPGWAGPKFCRAGPGWLFSARTEH